MRFVSIYLLCWCIDCYVYIFMLTNMYFIYKNIVFFFAVYYIIRIFVIQKRRWYNVPDLQSALLSVGIKREPNNWNCQALAGWSSEVHHIRHCLQKYFIPSILQRVSSYNLLTYWDTVIKKECNRGWSCHTLVAGIIQRKRLTFISQ